MRAALPFLLLLALGACDSGPPFTFELRIDAEANRNYAVTVDGEPLTPTVDGDWMTFEIVRQYDDFETATEAPPIRIQAAHDGTVFWDIEYPPDGCADHADDDCGAIVRSSGSTCFRDGGLGGLCGGLTCFDEEGSCGGYIAGPDPDR